MDRWDPDTAVSLMLARAHAPTWRAPRRFSSGLLAAAERADTRLPDLKVFICGGASVPPSLIRRAAGYFEKAAVSRVYGRPRCRSRPSVRCTTSSMRRTPTAAPASPTSSWSSGEICARGPQMLVGYLHPEDETASFDDEGYLPHRRSRPLGRRRVPGGHRPRQGHHHPQRREHLAQGGRGHAGRASRHRRGRGRRRARRAHRRAGVRGHRRVRSGRARPRPTCATCWSSEGVAKFKMPEQVVIWDALPKNDAGKVLKHQIRAALTEVGG